MMLTFDLDESVRHIVDLPRLFLAGTAATADPATGHGGADALRRHVPVLEVEKHMSVGSQQTRPTKSPGSLRLAEFVEKTKDPRRPYLVYKAKGDTDLGAVDTLWNAVYGDELRWLTPANGQRHKDRYDDHCTYLLARVEGQIVGTMRLVMDSHEGLPVERFVSIDDLRPGKRLIECQRLMVLKEFRSKRYPELPYGVFAGLIKAALQWCILNGVTHILADLFTDTKTTPLSLLKALGFEETGKEFIDAELSEASLSVALLLRVGELFSRPFRSTNPFYHYLMEYDETIDIYH